MKRLRIPTPIRHAITAAMLCVAGACGIDQGGARIQPAAPSPTTIVVSGPITGFGSVHLNGLVLDTVGATVRIDGAPAVETNLHEGQMIRAIAERTGAALRALVIEQQENVIGPIDQIDATNGTMIVLGQRVRADDATRYDLPQVAGLVDLNAGDRVAISGFSLSGGEILATHIGGADPTAPYQLAGSIASADSLALRFDLGGLTVDYSQSGVFDVATGIPQVGAVVEVRGATLANGVLVADEVRTLSRLPGLFNAAATALSPAEAPLVSAPSAALEANFVGIVSDANLPGRVSLGGVDVLLDSTTQIVGGSATDLAVGRRLQVEGTISVLGQIRATRIQLL
jgi:hypothetical protein